MNSKWICKIPALMAAGLFGLGGCDGSIEDDATGIMNIGLTDGPVDNAEAIHIQFTGLELKPAGGPPERFDLNSDSCDEFDTAGNCTIDLLLLQGTKYRTLFSGDLPAGDYQWVRLLVNAEQNVMDSYITINNEGTTMDCPLWIPSGGQTGLKIVSGMTVTTNGVSNYMLDFDARTSVTAPPGLPSVLEECVQNYILKPAIHIVDETEVGSIAGTIDPDVLKTTNNQSADVLIDGCRDEDIVDGIVDHLDIYVFENFDAPNNPVMVDDYDGQDDPITSAIAEWNADSSTYEYEVGYLLAGDYKLGLTCTADVDVMPNDDGLVAENFNCDLPDASTCEKTDLPFGFVAERDVNVTIGPLTNGDFPAP